MGCILSKNKVKQNSTNVSNQCVSQPGQSQSLTKVRKDLVRALVFKGGSVKGIGYLGCIEQLKVVGVDLDKVTHVSGTSAGSIVALLLALRLYQDQKKDKLKKYMNQDLTQFLDMENPTFQARIQNLGQSSCPGKLFTASEGSSIHSWGDSFGFAKGTNFRDWIDQIIFEETQIRNCTFEEFKKAGYKDLLVVAYDLTKEDTLIFSNETTPNAVISDAIRSSISIPFIFEPHKHYCKDEPDKIYAKDENHLIDGGIKANYPIQFLDAKENPTNPHHILGFYLTSQKLKKKYQKKFPPPQFQEKCSEEVEDNEDKFDSIRQDNGSPFYGPVWNAWWNSRQGKNHAKYEKEYDRTIYVDKLDISALDFNIQSDDKERLIEEGRKAVNEYFDVNPS